MAQPARRKPGAEAVDSACEYPRICLDANFRTI